MRVSIHRSSLSLALTLALLFLGCLPSSKTWAWVLPKSSSSIIASRDGDVPRNSLLHHQMTKTTSSSSSSTNNNNNKRNTNNDNKDRAMIEFMHRSEHPSTFATVSTSSSTTTTNPELLVLDDDTWELVRVICRAADGRRAKDVRAINVRHCTSPSLCHAIVICCGTSRPQNNAIVRAVVDTVEDEYYSHNQHQHPDQVQGNQRRVVPEGTADSGWIVLDYGSVMVHVMTPKSRLYYNIEGQWVTTNGGQYIPLDDVLMVEDAPERTMSSSTTVSEEDGSDVDLGLTQQEEWNIPQSQDPFWS